MSDHEDETINKENAPPKVVPQIITVTNISAKFPYLKKEEYDIWDKDNDGNLKIRHPVTAEEHQQARFDGNVESKKMQKSLLKQKFKEFKVFEEEGLDKDYDKMQKILTQMNALKIKPDPKDVNMKFLRGLPPSCSGIALILKTKGGLEYISFIDLYIKLKFLEIDTKGYLSSSSTLSNVAFVSTAGSSQGNLSYQESGNGGYTTTLSVSPGSSSSKGSSKSKCSVVDDVIYSFFANHEIDQHLVYEDLDQINKEDFEEYDIKHQMAMLSIKVHRFEKKHGRKIKFIDREIARFDKKLVKLFNCKQIGHLSRECQAQGGQNGNNYQKYKSKEAGKDESDSKAIVVVDGSIDWDKQTEEGKTEPRSLENFGMVAGIEIASNADLEGEVVSADDAIPAGVSVSAGDVVAAIVSLHSETEFALMGLSIEEGKLGIDDSKFSIFHTNSDELEGQPIYNSQECSRPNHSDHDSNDSISSVSVPASESKDTIVIDCARQEDFLSVCTSSIETDVKSSKTMCTKFGSFNKESHFRKHKSIASKSCYVCGSYLHLIKDYDLHEQRLVKRNAEGKGKLGRRPTGKPVNLNRPKPVSASQLNLISAGQQNLVSAGQPNPVSAGKATLACNSIPLSVSAGNGILGPRPLNIQPKSTYFHSFTYNNQQIIFPITHNSFYSLYMTGGLNGKTAVKPSACWPWIKYGMLKIKGFKINGGSKSKSWSYAKGPLGRPKSEMTWVPKEN
nr:hypothetical protein [Tanacetum cinerariifolium]